MNSGKHHFVLYRLNWERTSLGYGKPVNWFGRYPGKTRMEAFIDPDEAYDTWRKMENEARAVVNPFRCSGMHLSCQTHMEELPLHDWLLDRDIDPPVATDGKRDWAQWWEEGLTVWTPEQQTMIWDILDKMRFYQVIEEPVRDVVFLVQQIGWIYNDQGYDAVPEGGAPIEAFRSRGKAEARLQELEADRRASGYRLGNYDLGERISRNAPFSPYPGEVYATEDKPIFMEIVEMELTDGSGGGA